MKTEVDSERRQLMKYWMPWILGSLILAIVCWRFVGQMPPARIGIAAGPRGGAYHAYTQAYGRVFAENGVILEPRETAGSLENYRLLRDPARGISAALVQGGTKPAEAEGLMTVARVFLEPIWIFVRSREPVTDLEELAGRRISIGIPGSGTREVAARLLEAAGIGAGGKTDLLALDVQESIAALEAGAVDAAFFVSAPAAPYLKDLLRAPGIRLMDLRLSESYSKVLPFLRPVRLLPGTLDLTMHLPAEEVHLVAPVASLIAREDLHPAIVFLLLEATFQVHGDEGLLADPGTFPNCRSPELPIDPVARDFFRSGPPFVQRYLPFWVAAWLNRLKVLIVPLIVIFLPLLRLAPALNRWRIRRKVYRWYEDLQALDRLASEPAGKKAVLERLSALEKEIAAVRVPLSYMVEYYHLRLHADLIRRKIEERVEVAGQPRG